MLLSGHGSTVVSYDDVVAVPVPEPTSSWQPISNAVLIQEVKNHAGIHLLDYHLLSEDYCLARGGNQMFGVVSYGYPGETGIALSIGIRNSYNRTLSTGIAIGAKVTVCSNLMFAGEIVNFRRHTKHAGTNLADVVSQTLSRADGLFQRIDGFRHNMMKTPVMNTQAFGTLGRCYGFDILSERQLPIAKREWLEPSFPEFQSKNAWRLYNAVTFALKNESISSRMEKLVKFHEMMKRADQ